MGLLTGLDVVLRAPPTRLRESSSFGVRSTQASPTDDCVFAADARHGARAGAGRRRGRAHAGRQRGAGVQQQELEAFAHALGPVLTGRLRRLFFERELGDLDLKVMADPAEAQVLVMPLGPARPLAEADVRAALEQVQLIELVLADPGSWQQLDALVAIPWRAAPEA